MISIEIEVADDGTVTVGVQPQEEETAAGDMQQDKAYMQPAKSVDDALQTAKMLLEQGGQGGQGAAQGEVAFSNSFNR